MELQENEILNRWNDSMKRACSSCREMADHNEKYKYVWFMCANRLDELRRRGNVMAQGKMLSKETIERSLDAWQLNLGRKTDAAVAKEEKKKKRFIIDG